MRVTRTYSSPYGINVYRVSYLLFQSATPLLNLSIILMVTRHGDVILSLICIQGVPNSRVPEFCTTCSLIAATTGFALQRALVTF